MATVRLLSLDGGGTRGVITIEYLKKIEQLIAPKKLHEYFDLIAGTSTGSLLAICIAYLRMSTAECEEFYLNFARQVFPANVATRVSSHSEIGNSTALRSLLQEQLGDRLLTDISCPKVMITSTCQRTKVNELCLFRNYEVEDDIYPSITTASVVDAAMASTAAPIYLLPYTIGGIQFVDGGLSANNPAYIAFCQSYRLWPEISKMLVVSLGTGTSQDLLKKLQDRSISAVGSATLSNALHDVTSSEKIHKQLQELLLSPTYATTTYLHLQVVLSESDYTSLNTTSPEKFRRLQLLTRKYLDSNDPAVVALKKYEWRS